MDVFNDRHSLSPSEHSYTDDHGSTQGSIRVTVSQLEHRSLVHMIWQRKNAREHLRAMENRIRSLRMAEIKADKKVGEAKRLVSQKMTHLTAKIQDEQRQIQAKAAISSEIEQTRRRIAQQREEMKANIAAKQAFWRRMKRDMARNVRNVERERLEVMQGRLEEERNRKVKVRLAVRTAIGSRARASTQETPRGSLVQQKKDEERRLRLSMEQRIHELKVYEKVLLQSVREKYVVQAEELQRLEEIITKPKETYRRLSLPM